MACQPGIHSGLGFRFSCLGFRSKQSLLSKEMPLVNDVTIGVLMIVTFFQKPQRERERERERERRGDQGTVFGRKSEAESSREIIQVQYAWLEVRGLAQTDVKPGSMHRIILLTLQAKKNVDMLAIRSSR